MSVYHTQREGEGGTEREREERIERIFHHPLIHCPNGCNDRSWFGLVQVSHMDAAVQALRQTTQAIGRGLN